MLGFLTLLPETLDSARINLLDLVTRLAGGVWLAQVAENSIRVAGHVVRCADQWILGQIVLNPSVYFSVQQLDHYGRIRLELCAFEQLLEKVDIMILSRFGGKLCEACNLGACEISDVDVSLKVILRKQIRKWL